MCPTTTTKQGAGDAIKMEPSGGHWRRLAEWLLVCVFGWLLASTIFGSGSSPLKSEMNSSANKLPNYERH